MKKDTGKSTTHFELKESLEQDGCAVCRLVSKAGHDYLDNLLYELVNDPDVQKEFRDSLGPCNRHAYEMLDMRDALGISILYRVVVRQEIEHLSQVPGTSEPSSTLLGIFSQPSSGQQSIPEPGSGCMVCRSEKKSEERYLRTLLDGAEDGSLEEVLDGPGAVCVRHLSRASALADGSMPEALIDITRAAMEELEEDLDKHVRHNDYRFRDEPWGAERDAHIRAVRRMVGRRLR